MYLISAITFSILLINTVRSQSYPCSCSCCLGQGCQLTQALAGVNAQQCNDASCLQACKARHYQCNVSPPNGQAFGRCLTVTTTTTTNSPQIGGPYTCRCNCCNTGSYSCSPALVGYTNAYSCQIGACSIACTRQYPNLCVNNQNGQTQGTCIGTVTSTPTIPTGSVRCGCSCFGASGTQNYEVTTTNGCSSCLIACQSINLQCYNHQNNYCI